MNRLHRLAATAAASALSLCACLLAAAAALAEPPAEPAVVERASGERPVFAKTNLVAWCIVPFDAKKRGPRQRADMLSELGIRRLAYDWREVHVPTFEEEIRALRDAEIEFFAFWSAHEEMFRLFEKYGLTPQVWTINPSPAAGSRSERVAAAGRQLLPLVKRTAQLGCPLGLYNHGGWGGEPRNLVAVCRWLREQGGAEHVGIVYNFHHGHEHIDDFAESLALMQPYLLCLNLNGMNRNAQPKILPLGDGAFEAGMMQAIRRSGYRGPIGILDHRPEVDAEQSLRENLAGMQRVLKQIGDAEALATYGP